MMISSTYLTNMNKHPILSICIPTNGVKEFVVPSLESIYNQGVDDSLFEVVITDNGKDSELGKTIKKFEYPNLRYIQTDAQGFMNQICSFQESQGVYIKMINHRALFYSGGLQKMIDFITKYQKEKPMLYFPNGHLGGIETTECQNLDEFINKVSFWSSWEQGVGIWQEDKKKLDYIKYDNMFPAVSILFGVRKNSKYIIYDHKITHEIPSQRVRQYDFFKSFAVSFLDVIWGLQKDGRISLKTFNYVKKDMFRRYLISYYYQIMVSKTEKTIPQRDIKKNMTIYYSIWEYYFMIIYSNTVLRIKDYLL